ncbi:MAG: zf-HC2 domain-containing protein [Rubrobacteraceae bacterium]
MSLPRDRCRECDPESVFELADGGLGPARKREVRDHLEGCPGCKDLYRREVGLSRSLCSLEYAVMRSGAVPRSVAMALPTRRLRARFMWALLAAALLAVSLLALELYRSDPIVPIVDVLGMFWGFLAGAAEAARAAFAAVAPVLLIALGVGALFDLVIAAAVLTAARRSRRA